MFSMDRTVGELVKDEYESIKGNYPFLQKHEVLAGILTQLEGEGDVMRFVRRDGKTIAWKITPQFRRQAARLEADARGEAESDLYE